MSPTVRTFSCACGRVRCEAVGAPILSGVCYCLDCQEGGRRIEALSNAPRVRDEDGGTPYLTYRDDRFRCIAGDELLEGLKLKPDAPTRRVVASCCNTGMFLKYAPGWWVSAYRHRFEGDVPPIGMRSKVEHRQSDLPLPDDAPVYGKFPLSLFWRLIVARVVMFVGR